VPNNLISANISNGSLSRSGDVWVAKPTAIGKECIVTVSAIMDGKSRVVTTSTFRVRPLPEARAFILYTDNNGVERRYKGGTGFSKAKLLSTSGIIAALDDDLLEVDFTVLSFKTTIYDSMGNSKDEISQGSKFSDNQLLQIRSLSRGKRLWVTGIRAVGPDKVEQMLPPMEVIIN
jgi:gliding motility-associated protein GldM